MIVIVINDYQKYKMVATIIRPENCGQLKNDID
jgi:hypothetical protein